MWNHNEMERLQKNSILLLLPFASLMLLSFQIQYAFALTPGVVSVAHWTRVSDNHAILNITITHVGSPIPIGPSHYVSVVEIDYLNGTIIDLNQPTPQSTQTFVVQYDMEVLSETVSVRARAFCNYPGHGWSSWSNTVIVPEYSFFSLILVFAFVIVLVVTLKFKFGVSKIKKE